MAPAVIINELLCFVSNHIDLLEVTILKKLCLETYSADEIITAKNLLEAQCTANNVALDNRLIKRIGADKDVRNLDDIVMMFLKLGNLCPIFVAANINKLPPVYLEHTDVCALLKKLHALERDMAVLKTSHGSQDDEIRMIKTTIQSRPYASVARSGGNGNSTGPPRLPLESHLCKHLSLRQLILSKPKSLLIPVNPRIRPGL